MQIGQGGSLPASSGMTGARTETAAQRPDPHRAHAGEPGRAAQRRVAPAAAQGEPSAAAPRRNLPRGTLVNITV